MSTKVASRSRPDFYKLESATSEEKNERVRLIVRSYRRFKLFEIFEAWRHLKGTCSSHLSWRILHENAHDGCRVFLRQWNRNPFDNFFVVFGDNNDIHVKNRHGSFNQRYFECCLSALMNRVFIWTTKVQVFFILLRNNLISTSFISTAKNYWYYVPAIPGKR